MKNSRMHQVNFLKGCLSKVLLGPFLSICVPYDRGVGHKLVNVKFCLNNYLTLGILFPQKQIDFRRFISRTVKVP